MPIGTRLQGRTYFIVNAYIRFTLGVILFLAGIILWIIQNNIMLLSLSLIGLVAIFSGWYMWRRAHSPGPTMQDVQV
jgi:hypothetical protein